MLISADELRTRVAELGAQISRDYGDEVPVVVGVLQGAFLFMADLVRAIPTELTNVAGTLFFSAADATRGRELWKTNGTEAGTVRVADIDAGLLYVLALTSLGVSTWSAAPGTSAHVAVVGAFATRPST